MRYVAALVAHVPACWERAQIEARRGGDAGWELAVVVRDDAESRVFTVQWEAGACGGAACREVAYGDARLPGAARTCGTSSRQSPRSALLVPAGLGFVAVASWRAWPSRPRWSWRPEESGGSRPREIGTHIVQPCTPPGGITPGPTPSTTHASSPAKSRQGSPDRRSPQKPVGRAAKSGRLELAIELAVLPQKNCSPTGVCTLALQQARRPSRLSNLFRW